MLNRVYSPGHSTIVLIVVDALLDKILVDIRHDFWVQRVQELVLVIGHDHQDLYIVSNMPCDYFDAGWAVDSLTLGFFFAAPPQAASASSK